MRSACSGATSVRSLITMRPLVVSITIAFALSRLAGSGWAIAGAAQISAASTARIRIMKTPVREEYENVGGRVLTRQPANLVFRLAATDGGTNADTSPPMAA